MSSSSTSWLGRWALCAVAAAAMIGVTAPAQASTPASVDVTCSSASTYGGQVDCTAASLDALGNFGTPGTFTFDPGHQLPATWGVTDCSPPAAYCAVSAQLATPVGASPHTFTFDVGFVGTDGSTATTLISVDVTLQPTLTTVACDQPDLPPGGSTHCLISVVDTSYDGSTSAARLPAGVAGMTATSSDPSDVVTYDASSADHRTCVAAVADGALACGFTIALDRIHGLHTVTASYPGNPTTDEAASDATVAIADGDRVPPLVSLSCPTSVPALHPQTSCTITVTGQVTGAPVPTGTVELDQVAGQPLPWDSGVDCALVDGACTIPYEVFEGSPSEAPAPVRALYSGDDNYLPGSASQTVAVIATGSVTTVVCDTAGPATFTPMHCTFSVSTVDGRPAPVGPLDAITIATSSGSTSCDQPAAVGCGHLEPGPAAATVGGFTLRVGRIGGPQTVTVAYSGDAFSLVAPSSATFAFTAVAPPLIGDEPPAADPVRTATSTTVSCGPPVAYRHDARCVVTVKAVGPGSVGSVPAGTVRLAPAAGQHTFASRACTVNGRGQCTFVLAVSALPGQVASMAATYAGGPADGPSAGVGRVTVRSVATSATVRCSHPSIVVGAAVHCVASVRTEFGAAAAVPSYRKSAVTVTAHGDVIAYQGGRSCHWVRHGNELTCAFSVKVGLHGGSRAIHVYYTGDHASRDAASTGVTTLKVTSRR